MVPSPTRRSIWRTTFYALLGLSLLLMAFYTYAKFEEHLEWKRVDELLAEQDRKHPHWRWHEFLPKPLQPGEVNDALRFIEVGKRLTEEMLAYPNISGSSYDFKQRTREWLTCLEGEATATSYRITRERCKALEKELPRLADLQPGCPPIHDVRPSPEAFWLGEGSSRKPFFRDEKALYLAYRWLLLTTRYYISEGKGDDAILAWRALLAINYIDVPGQLSSRQRMRWYGLDFQILYQLLAKTEPGESALRNLQETIVEWRSHLFTLDDVHMDSAWMMQFLHDMKEKMMAMPKNAMLQEYAKPPRWLPESWSEWAKEKGVGAPSYGQMFRQEYQTHLRLFDFFEEKVKSRKPFYLEFHSLFDDLATLPGLHFHMYFGPRWKMILRQVHDLEDDLSCMEALIAAERFRLKTGDYPKNWNDLVPTLLKEIPKSGDKQFILKPDPEGLVIYLPGEKDHGGKVLRTYNPETKELDWETDHGLMIFYPKHRRQPPPPVKPKEKQDE